MRRMESDLGPEDVFIRIEPGALADILLAIKICPVEISGFGKVIRKGNVFTICDDIVILEQTCSSLCTEIDPLSHAKWQNSMARNGRRDEVADFRLWWHSHVNAPAYFSGIDTKNIWRLGADLEEWLISFVANKSGSFDARLDIFKPNPLRPVRIPHIRFTKPTDRNSFSRLMLERYKKVAGEINDKVVIQGNIFEKILSGLFGKKQGSIR